MERGSDWPLFLYTGQSFLKFDDGERQSLATLSLRWQSFLKFLDGERQSLATLSLH